LPAKGPPRLARQPLFLNLMSFTPVRALGTFLLALVMPATALHAQSVFTVNESVIFRPAPDEHQRLAIDMDAGFVATPPDAGEIITMPLDGVERSFRVTRKTQYVPGVWSVIARDVYNQSRYATLTFTDDQLTGKILSLADEQVFHLGTDSQSSSKYLARMRNDRLLQVSCAVDESLQPETLDLHPVRAAQVNLREMIDTPSPLKSVIPNLPVQSFDGLLGEEVVLDVMMVHTQAAASEAFIRAGITIDMAIAQTMTLSQLALDNSETGITLRLVHTHQTSYNNDLLVGMEVHLRRITTETGVFRVSDTNEHDNFMDEVHTLRREHGADVVALYVQDNSSTLGIAWRLSNYAGSPRLGFSVNSIRAFNTFTVIHEIGHNLGAAHGRTQSQNAASLSGGLFEYSTGWQYFAPSPNADSDPLRQMRHTVMHYGSSGSISYPGFSNPDVSSEGGFTGSRGVTPGPADNAQALRQIKHTVAGYLPTITDAPAAQITEVPVDAIVGEGRSVRVHIPVSNNGASPLRWSAEVVPGVESVTPPPAKQGAPAETTDAVEVLYETGFESTEGFATGTYEAHRQLRTNNATRSFDIANVNAKDGSQHFRNRSIAAASAGEFVSAVTPLFGRGQVGAYTASFDMYLSGDASSRYDVYIYSAQTGGIAGGFVITNDGLMYFRVAIDGSETFGRGNDTPQLELNRFYRVDIAVNAEENTLTYALDGVEFARVPMLQHRTFDYILFGRVEQDADDFMDIDNLRVTRLFSGYSWLSFAEPAGTIAPGETGYVAVDLDAATLTEGETLEGNIVIRTSDPNNPTVTLPVRITVADPTSADAAESLPAQIALSQNFPNPFNPATTITYALPEAMPVTLRIYDVTGRVVAVLVDEVRAAGEHQARFDARELSSGLYMYELSTPQTRITRKMMLVK